MFCVSEFSCWRIIIIFLRYQITMFFVMSGEMGSIWSSWHPLVQLCFPTSWTASIKVIRRLSFVFQKAAEQFWGSLAPIGSEVGGHTSQAWRRCWEKCVLTAWGFWHTHRLAGRWPELEGPGGPRADLLLKFTDTKWLKPLQQRRVMGWSVSVFCTPIKNRV